MMRKTRTALLLGLLAFSATTFAGGAISMLLGRGSIAYGLPSGGVDISVGIPAVVSVTLTSAGATSTVGNSSGTQSSGNWITPTSLAPGTYTIRVHQNSGTAVTGSALDSDLALSSTRSWTLTRSGVGTNTANITLTLKTGGGATVATVTFDLSAQQAA